MLRQDFHHVALAIGLHKLLELDDLAADKLLEVRIAVRVPMEQLGTLRDNLCIDLVPIGASYELCDVQQTENVGIP